MERAEIHVVDAQGDVRAIGARRDACHEPLAMNALLAEAVIRGKFDFDSGIWPTEGNGRAAESARQAISRPLRLMFSVCASVFVQRAGEVTWHRNFTSIRGLSRLLICFISLG